MEIYVGDLHIHTNYSDGANTPEQIVLSARNSGLDFISITDHNQFDGAKYAKNIVEKYVLGLIVILGEEITTNWGHLLALNIKEYIPHELSPKEICKRIHEQSGYVFAAHPYWKTTREQFWEKGIFEQLLSEGDLDGFELINAEAISPEENYPVIEKNRELCLQGRYYPVIGNSDAHKIEQLSKNIKMYVLAESLTEENIMKSIIERKCVIEWQQKYYGNEKYVSEVESWYMENFIDHLRICQQEVAPFI